MFHIHIAGSGCDDYWNSKTGTNRLMGKWFEQLSSKVRLALVFLDWPGDGLLDVYCFNKGSK